MKDALEQVKADLGPNAVILSTQRLDDHRGGHGESLVEIRAALDSIANQPTGQQSTTGLKYFQKVSRGRAFWPTGSPESAQSAEALQSAIAPLMDEVRTLRALVEERPNAPRAETPAPLMDHRDTAPQPHYDATPHTESGSWRAAPAQAPDARPIHAPLPEPHPGSARVAQPRDEVTDLLDAHPIDQAMDDSFDIAFEYAFYDREPLGDATRDPDTSLPGAPRIAELDQQRHASREGLAPWDEPRANGSDRWSEQRALPDDEPTSWDARPITPAPQHPAWDDAPPQFGARVEADDAHAFHELRRALMTSELPPDQAETLHTRRRPQATAPERPRPVQPAERAQLRQQQLKLLERWLRDADVATPYREELIHGVRQRLDSLPGFNRDQLEGAFIQELIHRVRIHPRPALDQRRTVAFIGPTGVGKTTTLAKRAAELTLNQGRSVGILTIDTYRVGAVAQLRKYASMLRTPLEVVIDRPSLRSALRRLEHCDVILIDTIGRSPRDPDPLHRLGALLQNVPDLSYELCVSATTALRDMRGIVNNYRTLHPSGLLFTKLDETFAAGPMLCAHLDEQLPLTFFTTGQSVPDDIENASIERVMSMIVPML
ncbi:MAG: hypothetical protein CMH57_14605 [Myxococcales bacterium]|nr:hypothetical protein [Myxococcales bacterium]